MFRARRLMFAKDMDAFFAMNFILVLLFVFSKVSLVKVSSLTIV